MFGGRSTRVMVLIRSRSRSGLTRRHVADVGEAKAQHLMSYIAMLGRNLKLISRSKKKEEDTKCHSLEAIGGRTKHNWKLCIWFVDGKERRGEGVDETLRLRIFVPRSAKA